MVSHLIRLLVMVLLSGPGRVLAMRIAPARFASCFPISTVVTRDRTVSITAASSMTMACITNDGDAVADGLTSFFEFVEDVSAGFDMFDEDGDDHITRDELRNVLASLDEEPSDADLDAIMCALDADGNGTIEFDEFIMIASNNTLPAESAFLGLVQRSAQEAQLSRRQGLLPGLCT